MDEEEEEVDVEMDYRGEPFLLINKHRTASPFEVFRVWNRQTIPINPAVLDEEDDRFLFSDGRWVLTNFDVDEIKLVCFQLSMSLRLQVYCIEAGGQRVDAQFIESGTFTGSPESECTIFLIEIMHGDCSNSFILWSGTLANWVIAWTREVFVTPSSRAFSPIYSDNKIYWVDRGGETYCYDLVTGDQLHFVLPDGHPAMLLDEDARFGAMAYLVTIGGTVHSILVSMAVYVYVFCLSQDEERMIQILENNFGNCHGSLFVSRNQGAIFLANGDLNGHLRDTLWTGPVPLDCQAFSLLTKQWDIKKFCFHPSCEGLWLLLHGDNFFELLQQELRVIRVHNLPDHEEEEEREEEEEEAQEEEEDEGEVIDQDSYRGHTCRISDVEAVEFGIKLEVKHLLHRVIETYKDNADKAFADCSIPQEQLNEEISAELEISDASGDEDPSGKGNKLGDVSHLKPLAGDLRRHSTKSAKKSLGPAPYTRLKMNLLLHWNQRSQTIDEVTGGGKEGVNEDEDEEEVVDDEDEYHEEDGDDEIEEDGDTDADEE